MSSSLALLAVLLLQAATSRASPSVPVSTQAIVTTITAPTVSNSLSTAQTVIQSVSSYENIQTITTTDSSGNTVTTTQDNGPVTTTIAITSNVVATIPITSYITFTSTIGETTILGPDPTTSAATTSTPDTSVVNVSPTSSFSSLGITYASTSTEPGSAAATSSASSSATGIGYKGPSGSAGGPPPLQTSGMSTGAKAAIGTAAVVICIFAAILGFWLFRMRRQRKAIREQYPDGQAPGDETGIFGFFSPIVGKPYEKEEKDIVMEKQAPPSMDQKPSNMVRELPSDAITPPGEQGPPYRRPIPQRNPQPLHAATFPIPPSHHNPMPQFRPQRPRRPSYDPNAYDENGDQEPFQKGFPRPVSRFPSHHASRSSGNIPPMQDFHARG